MLKPSLIVIKPLKGLKTFKVSVKRIWLLSLPSCKLSREKNYENFSPYTRTKAKNTCAQQMYKIYISEATKKHTRELVS